MTRLYGPAVWCFFFVFGFWLSKESSWPKTSWWIHWNVASLGQSVSWNTKMPESKWPSGLANRLPFPILETKIDQSIIQSTNIISLLSISYRILYLILSYLRWSLESWVCYVSRWMTPDCWGDRLYEITMIQWWFIIYLSLISGWQCIITDYWFMIHDDDNW